MAPSPGRPINILDGSKADDLEPFYTHGRMLRYYRTAVLQLMGPGELRTITRCKPNCWLVIYEIHGRAQGRAKRPERKEGKYSAKKDKQQRATERRLQAPRQNGVEDSGPGVRGGRESTKGGALQGGAPQGGAPQGGAPQGGAPQGGSLQGGAPQGGTLQGGAQGGIKDRPRGNDTRGMSGLTTRGA